MISTTIFPGRYVQGYGAIKSLGKELAKFDTNAFIICDPYVYDNILPSFRQDLERDVEVTVERFGGECTDDEIKRLSEISCGPVAGIGGGKTIDTAKAVAHRMNEPVVIVPTTASTDAPTSALSVIYTPEGEFERYLILPTNPNVVLVDTNIIAHAPVRFLVSGMGDALATWFEAEAARSTHSPNMTGNLGSMSTYALARLCYDTLIEYGVAAITACQVHAVTPAFERVVEANTLLSGLGFESGGLGAAHSIHNGLTAIERTHDYLHGEKVAIGVLASLFLTDKPLDLIDEVYTFCEEVGLPTTLGEIGLEEATDEELMKVAEVACAEGETIYNEPVPVNPRMVVAALKTANAEGVRRLQYI